MRYSLDQYVLEYDPDTRAFEVWQGTLLRQGILGELEGRLLTKLIGYQLGGHAPDTWELAREVYGEDRPSSRKNVSGLIGKINRRFGAGYIGHVTGADGGGYELFTHPPFAQY
jgi:hypothetical protein